MVIVVLGIVFLIITSYKIMMLLIVFKRWNYDSGCDTSLYSGFSARHIVTTPACLYVRNA